MRALSVQVFRQNRLGDCTNGGVSSKHDELLILCDDGNMPVDTDNPPENLCTIVKRHLFGADVYNIRPYGGAHGAGWMFGGNFAYSSDSRFASLVGGMYGAVAIHDRQETPEQYAELSR